VRSPVSKNGTEQIHKITTKENNLIKGGLIKHLRIFSDPLLGIQITCDLRDFIYYFRLSYLAKFIV